MEIDIIILSTIFILAITLLFLEVFVIPGTTVFGIVGGVMLTIAIVYTYRIYGNIAGNISIAGTIAVSTMLFFVGKKFMGKGMMSLEETIDSKVNKFESSVKIGDTGTVHTVLRPNGKAIFNDEKIEVHSIGDFIDKGEQIEIVDIQQNKIIVKLLKK